MKPAMTAIERAFDLARSGNVERVEDIERILLQERYEAPKSHLRGGFIRKQLRDAIVEAKAQRIV